MYVLSGASIGGTTTYAVIAQSGASEQVGTHVAGAADYDSDGYADLLAARSATSVYLLFGHP